MAIEKHEGLSPTNGILGFGPRQEKKTSLLPMLKKAGKIERALVSFSLGD